MLWVMSNDPVFQQNCLIRTCSNHVLIGKHDCVARAVVNPAELLAVIELSLSCHWAVCLEAWWHNSRSWREHLCWPGVAKHKARTFRLYDSPFEMISVFSFFFPNVTNDDISYIIALSQCPCFVRLFPLHLSQNLLHGQYFIWVLHSLHAPDPQTWAFLSKVFGKHCWVRVCPLETSKIFKQHSSSHAGGLLNGAETERSAPNIFWIPVLHKLHRIAFDSSSPHRCWLVFYSFRAG